MLRSFFHRAPELKSPRELGLMREAGKLVAEALRICRGMAVPGTKTIEIDQMVAACNGGGGPLGHPRVYLNLGPPGRVECPYCSREFVNRAMAGRVAPETGVVMPSAHQAGEERPEESPVPRQPGAS